MVNYAADNGNPVNARLLRGRTAVVTGAARGIGRGIALRLAGMGAKLAMVDALDMSETSEGIAAIGGDCLTHRADLSDQAQVQDAGRTLLAALGRVDILVNNAGIHPRPVPIEQVELDFWRATMSVNVDAVFLLTQIFVPAMRAAGWGRIINLSSSSVNTAPAMGSPYVASKAAVLGLTRSLARELGGAGITVNAIAPNPVKTPGAMVPLTDEMFAQIAAVQAVPRTVEIEDVVGVAAFLCTDAGAMLTGQHLHVDGGMVLSD